MAMTPHVPGRVRRWLRPRTGRSLHRSELANLALFIIVALLLVLGATTVILFDRTSSARDEESRTNAAQTQCIADWADRYTTRAELITEAQLLRNRAQDAFVLGLAKANTPAQSRQLFLTYSRAVTEYNQTQAKNPIPPSPRLVC